jgi:hypothetical protein
VISVSKTVPVNPPDADVTLTRADVWKGLEAKANNALPFVPQMTRCEVTARSGDVIERDIEFRGEPLSERITLERPTRVTFERTRGRVLGTIGNEILEDDDGELSLCFSFDLVLEDVEAGSAAEREYEATMKDDYLRAAEATLTAIRRWVREGDPAAT